MSLISHVHIHPILSFRMVTAAVQTPLAVTHLFNLSRLYEYDRSHVWLRTFALASSSYAGVWSRSHTMRGSEVMCFWSGCVRERNTVTHKTQWILSLWD